MVTTRRQLLGKAVRAFGGWSVIGALGCERGTRPNAPSPRHDVWHSLRPAPTKRTEVGAAECDGRLYVAGGYLLSSETVAAVEAYDVAHDAWETVAPLPAPRNHLTLSSLNGRLYAIGGNDGIGGDAEKPTHTVWRLDPARVVWESVAPLPAPRAAHASAVADGRLYVIGGIGPNPRPTLMYDATADRWSERVPIPTERDHLGAAFAAGKIIAVAGRTGEKERNVVEAYDPQTDAWETLPPILTARHGAAVAAIGSTVYVAGGEIFQPDARTFATLESFDVTRRTWRTLAPMPTARHGAGGVAYQGRFYVLAGGPQPDLAVTDAAEVYVP